MTWPFKAFRKKQIRINLALEGGGAHGAFTWGVLDRLLEEPHITYEGLSGASAGAMNAVVMASGYLRGGRESARDSLHDYWYAISRASRLNAIHPTALDYFIGSGKGWSPGYLLLKAVVNSVSPYQLNPRGYNPLVPILEEHVDFERIKASRRLRLFVNATRVDTGAPRIFRNRELSARVLAASACLPMLFQAVELDDGSYWDGGYSSNPPLLPLLEHCRSRDTLVVQLSPTASPEVPTSVSAIVDRVNEIAFTSAMQQEFAAIDVMRRSVNRALLWAQPMQRRLRGLRLHHIDADAALGEMGDSSRINASWRFLKVLRDEGRHRCEQWLESHGDRLGSAASWER